MIFVYIFTFLLILGFSFLDKLFRNKDASAFTKSEYDKGSTVMNGIIFLALSLIIILSPVFNYYNIGTIRINILLNVVGLIIGVIGIIVRVIALKTLGKYFTKTLKKIKGHELVKKGIYKYIRHPGYSGNIILWIGLSVSVGNIISIISITLLLIIAYTYRIKMEEEMLIKIFGDKYIEYKKETKRIIDLFTNHRNDKLKV